MKTEKARSYPCSPGCTCGRHREHPRRNRSEASAKGWSDQRRILASQSQLGTHRSFDGFFVEELKGYHNAHGAIAETRGAAKTYECLCSATAFAWGLNHKNIRDMNNVKRDPKLGFYSLDVFDYIALCGSCHRRFDNE